MTGAHCPQHWPRCCGIRAILSRLRRQLLSERSLFCLPLSKSPHFERGWQRREPLTGDCRISAPFANCGQSMRPCRGIARISATFAHYEQHRIRSLLLQILFQLAFDALQRVVHGFCSAAEHHCDLLVRVAIHEQIENLLFKRLKQILDAAEDPLHIFF